MLAAHRGNLEIIKYLIEEANDNAHIATAVRDNIQSLSIYHNSLHPNRLVLHLLLRHGTIKDKL